MSTIRPGHRSVLLIVDVQVGVMSQVWEAGRVVGNVARLVEKARAHRVPVVWVQHGDDELVPGSPGWQWVSALVPAADEALVHKRFNSAFEETTLEPALAALGATQLVLAGFATNWCIRSTAYAALERGYDLMLVGDAHSTGPIELPDGRRVEPAGIVDELNATIAWLGYPGRRNATATVEQVDFAPADGAG